MFTTTSPSDLRIKLDPAPKKAGYCPGDTVTGCVFRTTPGVAPDAKVIVTLHGISKSKIVISRGNSRLKYKGSFDCLSAPMEPQLPQAGGPIHILEGSNGMSWPFAITVPSFVTDVRQSHHKKYYSSPTGVDGAPFPPPGSFEFSHSSALSRDECSASIEYYVQARLELSHEHNGRTRRTYHTATASIKLQNASHDLPITNFDLRQHRMKHIVTAYRLVPGVQELSLTQRRRQTFMSSKVPKLAFNVDVYLPRLLQIGNPNTIPLYIAIEPFMGSTDEIIHNVPQQITIRGITLRIKPSTVIQADRRNICRQTAERYLIRPGDVAALGRDICITVTPGASERPTPLNLGEIFNVHLDPGFPLNPTFTTYNIKRTYDLSFKLETSIVGEQFKLGWSHDVKILPASYQLFGNGGREALPGYTGRTDEELPAYEDC